MANGRQIQLQEIELLSVITANRNRDGESLVVLTIRPDLPNFRPHNIGLSMSQAERLFDDLGTIIQKAALRSAMLLLVVGLAGCSSRVEVSAESTSPPVAEAVESESQPAVTQKRTKTMVAVESVEITGNANFVTVIEGDLHLHRHDHLHFHEASKEVGSTEQVQIEIRRRQAEEWCERYMREHQERLRQWWRLFGQLE